MAAYGDWIVLSEQSSTPAPRAATTFVYELWNVHTGERKPGWESAPGTQDWLGEVSGDWLVTVRGGLSLPFAQWRLILRNLKTGEAREIAHDDPNVVHVPNLPVRLPSGFAPEPSISGQRVVWSEFVVGPHGKAEKRIELYDLASGKQSTLVSVDPSAQDVWSPSIAGNEVTWVHRLVSGSQELVVIDLVTARKRTFPVGGDIYSCALSADGRYLAWDDHDVAKHVVDLDSGGVLQYAGDEGWGTVRSGDYFSWQPFTGSYTANAMSPGAGGIYDAQTRQVRFVSHQENSTIMSATVMGNWFVWQDRSPSTRIYYFMRLGQ